MSEDLIQSLASDLKPARPRLITRRVGMAIVLGTPLALIGVLWVLGPRPDLAVAAEGAMFWMKLAYAGGFAAVGVLCVERLSRPGGRLAGRLWWIAAPCFGLLLMAAMQLARTPRAGWRALFMGESAAVCPWNIAAASIPILFALLLAMRSLGPTRLRLGGALAGLAAGGFGAVVYCFHCPESGGPFVAIWYTLGMMAPCLLGALLGPRLLRW